MRKARGEAGVRVLLVLAVAAIVPACGSSGGGGGAVAGAVVSVSGGRGTTGNGGNGDYFEIYNESAGDVELHTTGAVNATVTVPNVRPYLGSNAAIIGSNTVWSVGAELNIGDGNVSIGGSTATGLWIQPGVTLTVKPNFTGDQAYIASVQAGGIYNLMWIPWNWPSIQVGESIVIAGLANAANNGTFTVTGVSGNQITTNNAASVAESPVWWTTSAVKLTRRIVRLWFGESVLIEGTLKVDMADDVTAGDGAQIHSSWLMLNNLESLVVAQGGSIVASGADAVAGTTGGNGGYIEIDLSNTFVNQGLIDSTGGDDDFGGNGGDIYVYVSNYSVFQAGTINSGGGLGQAGNGGEAGDMDLESDGYGVHNNGSLLARGGNGTGDGGRGGDIDLTSNNIGAVTHAGLIDGSGGDSTDNGNGGDADDVDIDAYSGSVRLSGTIRLRGGNGGPNGGDGGEGNDIDVYCDGTSDYLEYDYVPEGVYISSVMDTSGGDGANGGDSDRIYIENYSWGYARRSAGIYLYGVPSISLRGGNGAVDGGNNWNSSYITSEQVYDYATGNYYGGRIYNEVPFDLRGGDGSTGDGGQGGYFEFYSNHDSLVEAGTGIVNVAQINVSGGNGGLNGGDGDGVEIYYYPPFDEGATTGIANSGAIDVRGGNGTTGSGGDAGWVYVYMGVVDYSPDLPLSGIENTASIYAMGGNGGTDGGWADYVEFYSEESFWIRNSADIHINGGNGDSGNGGLGGWLYMTQEHYNPIRMDRTEIRHSGTINCNGGNGSNDGGWAGGSEWYSSGAIVFSGTLTANGGAGQNGGASAGNHYFSSDISITVTGTVTSNGGSGGTSNGGSASNVDFRTKSARIAAAVIARGGNSTSASGGNGGWIEVFSTEGGSILSGSSFDVSGGTPDPNVPPATNNGSMQIDGILLASPSSSF